MDSEPVSKQYRPCQKRQEKGQLETENSTEAMKECDRVKREMDWTQTEKEIKIILPVSKCSKEDLPEIEFRDMDVQLTFKDGSYWHCTFYKEVEASDARAQLQKQILILLANKKEAGSWPQLQAEPEVIEKTTDVDSGFQKNENEKEKEEEQGEGGPYYDLSLAKHDFYEKDVDIIMVHMYVKLINKETLRMDFCPKYIAVHFSTIDDRFLLLHKPSTDKTVFRWKINLKDEIDPAHCHYRLSSSLIEMKLKKKERKRWGSLEAPLNKGGVPTASDSWITAGKPQTSKQSNVIFDEMKNLNKSNINTGYQPSENKENLTQKPTCMVSPLNKQQQKECELVARPGHTGLDNLGNTCFMNSVLQVLANTRELRDYFLESRFQKEINVENPLGTGGKLAVSFAFLLKVLWNGKHSSYAPSRLKNLIAMKASQFTGYAQHDAQEFMAYLLDGLHEDLNRIRNKPYTETVDSDGRPDEVVANEAWAVHKKRNDSFLVDLFQGQYKSKLVCPVCSKVSITFDPFMILPVPLPKKQMCVPVIFMFKDPYKRPVKYILRLSKDAKVELLKEALYSKTGVEAKNQRVFTTESYQHRIMNFFGKGSSLSNIQSGDTVVVCEVLSEEVAGEPVVELAIIQRKLVPDQGMNRCANCHQECQPKAKLKRCTRCYKVGYCNQICQKEHWKQHYTLCRHTPPELVGCPFIISLPESRATFSRLSQLIEGFARYTVDVFQPPVEEKGQGEGHNKSSPSKSKPATVTSASMVTSSSGESLNSETSSGGSVIPELDSPTAAPPGSPRRNLNNPPRDGSSAESKDTLLSSRDVSQSPPVAGHACTSPVSDEDKDVCSPVSASPSVVAGTAGGGPFKGVPTKAVLGLAKDEGDRSSPLFFLRPCDKDGRNLSGVAGEKLIDDGDSALELSTKYFLAMDWKNNDRLKPYVLVQTKDFDYDEDGGTRTNRSGTDDNQNISLEQCLDLFTEPEVLSPEHAWYCPKCKEHREATKQLSIWRLPDTLIIQLKRFSFRNHLWRDKIDKMVDFPIRSLDLGPYFIGKLPSDEPSPVYDLYGVINHIGGILGGHYTSYARCSDLADEKRNEVGWRLFDDSRVSVAHEKQVHSRAAYVLFYRRRPHITNIPDSLSTGSIDTKSSHDTGLGDVEVDTEDEDNANDVFHHVNAIPLGYQEEDNRSGYISNSSSGYADMMDCVD